MPDSPSFLSRHNTVKDIRLSNECEITEVFSSDGESLTLIKRINIDKGCETWLPRLKGKEYILNS